MRSDRLTNASCQRLRTTRQRPYPAIVERGRRESLRSAEIALVLALASCAGGATGGTGSSDTIAATTDTGSTGVVTTDDTAAATDTSSSTTSADTSSSDDAGAETSCEEVAWYPDMDGDGRGDPLLPVLACDPPPGHVAFDDDCDDTDPALSPAATELCDGIDNDCDALVDEFSTMNAMCNGCTLVGLDQHAYALCPDPLAWADARTNCQAWGGDLLVLDDDIEHAAVMAFDEPTPTGVGGWFFGLTDQTTEGLFVWPDGSAPTFTAWNDGEPNDAALNEDCAEMNLATGGWNDVPCSDGRAYVCEAAPS
jgi:hypothetical protein